MAQIAMIYDFAVLVLNKSQLENLELRFILARFNELLSYPDKYETKFLSSNRVESNLHHLKELSTELRNQAVLAKAYVEKFQVKDAAIEDLEGLEGS